MYFDAQNQFYKKSILTLIICLPVILSSYVFHFHFRFRRFLSCNALFYESDIGFVALNSFMQRNPTSIITSTHCVTHAALKTIPVQSNCLPHFIIMYVMYAYTYQQWMATSRQMTHLQSEHSYILRRCCWCCRFLSQFLKMFTMFDYYLFVACIIFKKIS